MLGASGVFVGAFLILYNGKFGLNIGDILIIASTATYPVGNYYAKKALRQVSSSTILFVRFLLGGLFILLLAMILEPQSSLSNVMHIEWPTLLFTGLVLLGVGKIIWYEALGRLDISKAIALGMTFPIFSLIILVGIFREEISRYQWIGIAIMIAGVFFTIRRASVDPGVTKYS